MKRLVLFLFSLWNIIGGLQVQAYVQEDTFPCCLSRARWVYLFNGLLNTNEYELHAYLNDTVIQNRTYKILEFTRVWQYSQFPNSPLFLDAVYYEYLRKIYDFYEGIDNCIRYYSKLGITIFQVNHWTSHFNPNWHLGGRIGSYHNFFPLPCFANCNSRIDDVKLSSPTPLR